MSVLPLNWPDKVDSPELLAWLQQFGLEKYIDSNQINSIRDALNELYFSSNPDRIISLGTETIDENEYTYEGYVWQLEGVQVNNIGNPSVIVIPSATVGFKRKDISVFTAAGTIERVSGTETDGEVVTSPDVPEGTLYYKSYDIDGNTIGVDPEPPAIDGSIYKKKIENTRWKSMQSGTNVLIPFQAAGQSHYSVVSSGLISVAGFTTTLLNAQLYEGQDVLFENQTGNSITLKDSFGAVPVPFDLGADLLVPNQGKIWFRFRNGKLELIMKSWIDVDLSSKADLVGGKVPASQLPSYVDDVLEYANLAAFPTTGESDKIYLALDTNFIYRWSGSIYIKISGAGVKGFHRFQSPNFAPAANTTYYIGGNNLGLLATAQTSNFHARVKAMVTGKIGKVSFFASAGLASGVGANVYLDNITKGTSLTIANNFIWTTISAVNYISTSDFLVDKGDELTIRLKIGGDGTGGGGGTNNNFWAELTIEE